MKRILSVVVVPLLASCSFPTSHELVLVFENFSESSVHDLRFSTTNDKEVFTADALSPGEEFSRSLEVKNYSADGNYTFQFVQVSGDTVTATGNYMEEDYIQNTLTFTIVNEGVEVGKKVVRRN